VSALNTNERSPHSRWGAFAHRLRAPSCHARGTHHAWPAIILCAISCATSIGASAQPLRPTADSALRTVAPPDTTPRERGLYDRYPWFPRLLGAQFTYIGQDMPPFHASYSGPHSLTPHGDHQNTHTYGVYFGSQVTPRLQLYADFEDARGAGVGGAVGLAGLTNGDVIRQGIANLGQDPYLARSFARYVIPIGAQRDTAERAMDHLAGGEPTTRIEIKAGKFALDDDLDQNRYASSTRYQFMDWGLWDNTAWDYAANTRGYTNGVLVGYVGPRWALRIVAAQIPIFANGNTLDNDIKDAHGLNAELTLSPGSSGTVLRFLAYHNRASMGIYREAIDIAAAHDTTPNIVADDHRGRVKYGFGFGFEQPLADSGNTGVFLRLGWNDGKTEDFVFTESDRHLSGGFQLAGTLWSRPDDRLGVADVVDGISEDHRDYLAAGGLGFLVGDGALRRYGAENVIEIYYRLQVPHLAFAQISPAIQHVANPGYNEDRGPLYVYSIRVNLHY
jgi:high affinity Mn2+ porin